MAIRSAKTQSSISPVYLVAGVDSFLLDQQVHRLVDQLITPDQSAMAFWLQSTFFPEPADILRPDFFLAVFWRDFFAVSFFFKLVLESGFDSLKSLSPV